MREPLMRFSSKRFSGRRIEGKGMKARRVSAHKMLGTGLGMTICCFLEVILTSFFESPVEQCKILHRIRDNPTVGKFGTK